MDVFNERNELNAVPNANRMKPFISVNVVNSTYKFLVIQLQTLFFSEH